MYNKALNFRTIAKPASASAALLAILALAACSQPTQAPQPTPPPTRPTPVPPPTQPAPPPSASWEDWAFTPGEWTYRKDAKGSAAAFAQAGQGALFTIRCDASARRIILSRPGFLEPGKTASLVIRASMGSAQYPLANAGGTPPYVAASLDPRDAILDKTAFSRGRFVVEVAGAPTPLVLPTWSEFPRVVEDCR